MVTPPRNDPRPLIRGYPQSLADLASTAREAHGQTPRWAARRADRSSGVAGIHCRDADRWRGLMSADRSLVIWKSTLLPSSETFVRNQANALTEWRPTFVGAIKVDSSIARDSDIIPFDQTPAGRRAFLRLRLTGRSPRLRRVLAQIRPEVIHAHFG